MRKGSDFEELKTSDLWLIFEDKSKAAQAKQFINYNIELANKVRNKAVEAFLEAHEVLFLDTKTD